MGKVEHLIFGNFLLLLTKSSFLIEDWKLDYNSMKFKDIFQIMKMWSLKLFGNMWDKSYLPFLSLAIMFCFPYKKKEKFGEKSESHKIVWPPL